MIALDDAAWSAPWRSVRVGEKLVLGGGLLLTALLAPPWPAAPLVGLAAIIATLGPARIPPRILAIGFAAPLAFITIGAISVALQVGNPDAAVWFRLGPLSMDATTAANGAQIFGRSAAGTLAILMMATTTPMVDMLGWARRRGVPGPLVEIASLTYRLLFVLLDVLTGTRAAQIARLADAPGGGLPGLRRRWNAISLGAMGSLLVRSRPIGAVGRWAGRSRYRRRPGAAAGRTRRVRVSWMTSVGLIAAIWALVGVWLVIG